MSPLPGQFGSHGRLNNSPELELGMLIPGTHYLAIVRPTGVYQVQYAATGQPKVLELQYF